jgi:hypothetical protein
MYSLIRSKWKSWFPSLIVVIWLLYLAITIWEHATLSQHPPLYDGLSYFLKGKNFWDLIWQHHIFNPFVWPSDRPPGTILMSFPFGYDNFQAFHFRSVFFAIVLSAIAGWISLQGNSSKAESAAVCMALILAFTSLPMFYALEPNSALASNFTWGHVDTFFASLAALAAAASLRSLHERSSGWLIFGVTTASFSLWIKPAGLVVMALLAGVWFVAAVSRILVAGANREARDRETRYFAKGVTITILLYTITVVAAVISGYLSRENVAYFKTALGFIGSFRTSWSIQIVEWIFLCTIGYPFGVLCIAGMAGAMVVAVREAPKKVWLNDLALVGIISGLGYLVVGIGWWVITADGVYVRYIFPFLLMFAVTLLPSIRIAAVRFGLITHLLVLLICFGSAANLAALLVTQTPALQWQKATGVNLSAGIWNGEVAAARRFLTGKTRERSAPVIYAVDPYPGAYIFESEVVFASFTKPDVSTVRFSRPIDWLRTSAYRFNDLLEADYLLVTPVRGATLPNEGKTLMSYFEEEQVMRVWISTLTEADGVNVEINLPNMLLLKVVDRSALRKAVANFTKRFTWRNETAAANQPVWWSAQTLSASARNPAAEDIGFGGVYKLHALAINRVEQGIKIDVWWEELRHEEVNNQRHLFIHLVDKSGKIIYNQQIALFPYKPLDAEKRWRHGSTTFYGVLPDGNLTSLAFGIYQPSGQFLLTDKQMPSDWEGRRVLIPLNAISDTVRK